MTTENNTQVIEHPSNPHIDAALNSITGTETNMPPDIDANPEFSIDDLIPDDLKAKVKEMDNKLPDYALEENEIIENGKLKIENKVEEKKTQLSTLNSQLDVDLDNLPEDVLKTLDIDKILEAESPQEALAKQLQQAQTKDGLEPSASQADDQPPFWHEEEEYKQLTQKLEEAGIEQTEIDKIIKTVADKTTINNSKYVQGLEDELDNLKKDIEYKAQEHDRLKKIEKSALFDSLPETKQKYSKPMQEDAMEMKKILDMEGENAPALSKLLNAPNKTEFTRLLKDSDIADVDLTRLTNHWRSYKETEHKYVTAKSDAINNLTTDLTKPVDLDFIKSVTKDNLLQAMTSNEQYKYLQEALNKKPEEAKEDLEVIRNFTTNTNNMLTLLKPDFARDKNYTKPISDYFLRAEHNKKRSEIILPKVEAERNEFKEKYNKAMKVLLKTLPDAKGIQGLNGTTVISPKQETKKDDKEIMDDINKFVSGKLEIDEFFNRI